MSAADAPTVKRPFFRRRKSCPFSGPKAPKIDWKDARTLSRYISERGKMVPSRITSVSQKNQRELAIAVKRARYMAMISYVANEAESGRPPRDRDGGRDGGRDRGPREDRDGGRERGNREERY
jgi:small subunit ribosomal protein S18